MKRFCENCEKENTCTKAFGAILGYCNTDFEPKHSKCNECLYTAKQCKHADINGECNIGQQNCGWENWHNTDDGE